MVRNEFHPSTVVQKHGKTRLLSLVFASSHLSPTRLTWPPRLPRVCLRGYPQPRDVRSPGAPQNAAKNPWHCGWLPQLPKGPRNEGDHLLGPSLKMDQTWETKRSKGRLWESELRNSFRTPLKPWLKPSRLLVFTEESSFQGVVGGAGFRPSAVRSCSCCHKPDVFGSWLGLALP